MSETAPARWKTLLAFSIIYFVWGATFFAIRVGVSEVPPLLFASMRFLAAGILMCSWLLARGERLPTAAQWLSILLLAAMIFVGDYGLVFWAEQRVPSGLTAVMLATIPAFMALSEIIFLRTQRLTVQLAAALAVGLGGVAMLVSRSNWLGGEPIDRRGTAALLIAAASWSVAGVLTKKIPLPASKAMSSGVQMLAGGVLLAVVGAAAGELGNFHMAAISSEAWIALAYLIVFGSIIAFTAYIWLIHHESPTKVGTYAYVNPIVAVILGYCFGAEPLGLRTVLGGACVLVSVLLITTAKPAEAVTGTAEPRRSEVKRYLAS